MSLRLEVKQSQKLVMNPQMQQAIKLLQLTNTQLTDMLATEMEQNPFLAFDAAHYVEHGGGVASASKDRVDAGTVIEQRQATTPTLADFLGAQIRQSIRAPQEQAWALELVGWLDDDGYLRDTPDDICTALDIDQDRYAALLVIVQGLDPAGIFARDLGECLALQCQRVGQWNAAYATLLANLDMLARGEVEKLATQCGVNADELRTMIAFVRGLSPRPAARYDSDTTPLAAPEIFTRAERKGRRKIWRAFLNEDSLPKVLVLERDWEEMARRPMRSAERDFLKKNIHSARWLHKAAQQRAATMLRVAEAIVAHQQVFFDTGMTALQPMGLRDIAEATELHESTVSRAVAAKLIETPHGVLRLRDLFSVGLGDKQNSGANMTHASAQSIKARLAAWVAAETSEAVISDDQLVGLLADEGIVIARRTIAKYRGQLNIPPATTRRRRKRLPG